MSADAPRRAWPPGDGKMAQRMRTHDWSATALGASDGWSERLKGAVEQMLASPIVATLALGPDRLLLYNDAAARLYAGRHPAALGAPLAVTFADSFPAVAGFYDRVFAGEAVTVRAQPLAVGSTGEHAIFDAYLTPVRDAVGSVVAAQMLGFEIGDRMRAEHALCQSERRYRAFVVASTDAVYRMSPDWSELRELEGYGFVADALEASDDWRTDYILDEDRAAVDAAIAVAMRDKSVFELELRVYRPDGTVAWALSRAVPILDDRGEIVEWIGAASDVTDRRRAQEALRRSEDRLQTLVAELQHRVRNILAVVRSVLNRSADRNDDMADLLDHFRGRLDALARTQMVLTQRAADGVDLENMIRDELLSVGVGDSRRVTIVGPDVAVPSPAAETIGLAIHELTTNALKYGALKVRDAALDIRWTVNLDDSGKRTLDLMWTEQGVPAVPAPPSREGFGRELIEDALPHRLDAITTLEFAGGGIRCRIVMPLAAADHRVQPHGMVA